MYQLVSNVNGIIDTHPWSLNPPSVKYEFISRLILSIEQLLLVIYMPLLIVRMAFYLIRCLPCIGTRNLGDMCKSIAYYGDNAVAPAPQPTVFYVQGGGGMNGVTIVQPNKY